MNDEFRCEDCEANHGFFLTAYGHKVCRTCGWSRRLKVLHQRDGALTHQLADMNVRLSLLEQQPRCLPRYYGGHCPTCGRP